MQRAAREDPSIIRLFDHDWRNVNTFIYTLKRQFAVSDFLNKNARGPVREYLLSDVFNYNVTLGIGPVLGMHEMPKNHFLSGFDICTQLDRWTATCPTGDAFEPPVLTLQPFTRELWDDTETRERLMLHGLTELEKTRIKADIASLQKRYDSGWLGFVASTST